MEGVYTRGGNASNAALHVIAHGRVMLAPGSARHWSGITRMHRAQKAAAVCSNKLS
jgi:hypothetical protein